jgi:hypothetical protein
MAEAYWDKEWELQQLGFDACYDKRLYDRLAHENVAAVHGHLRADIAYQSKLVRFIENHDEPRAATVFSSTAQLRAAAVAAGSQLGARLFHEGQFEGRRIKLPVFLSRRPEEPADFVLEPFYRRLLAALRSPVLHDGEWQLCERSGFHDNQSFLNLVAWAWRYSGRYTLIVVNLSQWPAAGRIRLPWPEVQGRTWRLEDMLNADNFERDGDELYWPGIFVALAPWGIHFLDSGA